MFEINLLPAKEGDAIWIRWGDSGSPYQMLIDLGPESTGRDMNRRLNALPAQNRTFELLVITHVDRDHIGGALSCLVDVGNISNPVFKDIWFNGWDHLHGRKIRSIPTIEAFGPVQGEKLARWLRNQSWNSAFDGGACVRYEDSKIYTVNLEGGMKVSVLGPTQNRLSRFIEKWKEEVLKAFGKGILEEIPQELEVYGNNDIKPKIFSKEDLYNLANSRTNTPDTSPANGSSISLLLEYEGKKALFSGDAFASDILEGLQQYFHDKPIELDLFKVPHHGSTNNLSVELVKNISCSSWLVSTDGTRFRHPDKEAIARIIAYSKHPKLHFNVKSKFNSWWNDADWQRKFSYEATFGDIADGISISL